MPTTPTVMRNNLTLSYFSILSLTAAVGSQVIRLLQGMIWSGPLLYSPMQSSVIMPTTDCIEADWLLNQNIYSRSALSGDWGDTGSAQVVMIGCLTDRETIATSLPHTTSQHKTVVVKTVKTLGSVK